MHSSNFDVTLAVVLIAQNDVQINWLKAIKLLLLNSLMTKAEGASTVTRCSLFISSLITFNVARYLDLVSDEEMNPVSYYYLNCYPPVAGCVDEFIP